MRDTIEPMTDNDDYLRRIGTLIRDARQHSGLTQTALATELKTSQSAINRIEKGQQNLDRKSTRLNSSHVAISYAVFCLKKKIKRGYLQERYINMMTSSHINYCQ